MALDAQDGMEIHREADGGYRLVARQRLSRPLEEVFPYFAEPRNLEQLTPPLLRFEVRTPGPLTMGTGLMIDYRLRLHGVPLRWQSEITAYEPGRRFVDEQRRGPYRYWIHEHGFAEQDGLTEVEDLVRYRPPGGRLLHDWFVAPDLRRIFAYRRRVLAQRFGEAPPAAAG